MLLVITAASMLVTILLVLPPLAPLLSFHIAHIQQVIAILLILLLYVITADWLKIYFFRKLVNTTPVEKNL